MSEADVLRLALDGHLTLSVYFVNGARGRCGPAVRNEDAQRTIWEENPDDWIRLMGAPSVGDKVFSVMLHGLPLGDGRVLEYDRETVLLDGVWDLTMLGHDRLEIEQRYQLFTEGPEVDMRFRDGPLATFRRKIRLSRIEVIWNACWKEDTPPAIPAGCLAKSFVIFGVSSLPISR
ncbi:hypothetical protein [Bradyrhizobium sp.]|uniref:hypothetical protein n=1 Tax=Bradyrhizobium sp. TaxID=376 RepID=UPI003BAEC64E